MIQNTTKQTDKILKFFNKNLYLKLIFIALLTLRNLVRNNILSLNLKTGNRKNNSSNTIKYIDFCVKKIVPNLPDRGNIIKALEIGPGDNNGLALSLLYEGVEKIDLIDRYQNRIDEQENYKIYESISETYGKKFKKLNYTSRIKRVTARSGLLGLSNLPNSTKYDLIYSVSVWEHLWPFEKNLDALVELCSETGSMINLVNFTDHGMFSPQINRFYFRKIPRFIYNPIMSPAGRPNRILPSEICRLLTQKNFSVSVQVMRTHTRVLEPGEVYSKSSIPTDELNEIFEVYGPMDGNDNKICDLAIGSAVIVAKRN